MKIFIDVDNTVLEHSNFYEVKTENRIHKTLGRNPIANETPIKMMYEGAIINDPNNFIELFNKGNVYILTKGSNDTYEKYKEERLASVLDISRKELVEMKDSNGLPKYMFVDINDDKARFIKEKFNLDSLKDCVLVDDYSENLITWEQNGGIGIKFFNEYNSPLHPSGGLVISNFKIFNQTYKLPNSIMFSDGHVSTELANDPNINHIHLTKIVENLIMEQFDIEKEKFDTQKIKHTHFVQEFYKFIEQFNPSKLLEQVESQFDKSKLNIIESPFQMNDKMYEEKLDACQATRVEFNSKSSLKRSTADIYVTIPSERIYEYKKDIIEKKLNLMTRIMNG